jgi:glycosyltransferase involved in cell wall biosynthesis
MNVCVASPYPLTDLKGNSVTTHRIVEILQEHGINARGCHGFDGQPADILISLHAVKGARAVADFRDAYPEGKVVILITGTDIYQFLPEGSREGDRALKAADAIVVVFDRAVQSLDVRWRKKAFVVPSSLSPVHVVAQPVCPPFAISVVGHLRPVKQPFLTIEAVARHPGWKGVEVWQIGEALDDGSAARAREWEARDPRYRWFGGIPREESLSLCARSSLTVNSSILEGGANAVLEAMTMGVPVLASRIEGNLGLLGDDYPGYFEGSMDESLSAVIEGRSDLPTWIRHSKERLPMFSREHESACWLDLLTKLHYFQPPE